MATKQFLFSNSTTKSWSFCETAYANGALRLGHGVSTTYVEEDLVFGSLVHDVMPQLYRELDDEKVAELIETQGAKIFKKFINDAQWEERLIPEERHAKACEWERLLIGMLWGVRRVLLPFLRSRYNLFIAEGDLVRRIPEWDFTAGDDRYEVGLIAKPDTLVEPRADVEVDEMTHPGCGYIEWKTVSSVTPQWCRGWVKNPQSWTGAITLKAALNKDIEWFQVGGLVKGTVNNGRRSSPLCYAYRCMGATKVDPTSFWTTEDGTHWRADYTNAKGWERVPTTAYPGGIRQWVQDVPQEVANDFCVLTDPDVIDWDLAEEWLGNQREMVDAAAEFLSQVNAPQAVTEVDAMRQVFTRRVEKCSGGAYNRSCEFNRLCHDPEVRVDPLMVYKIREPHHEIERVALGLNEKETE